LWLLLFIHLLGVAASTRRYMPCLLQPGR
jgi:hypothetical protein